VRQAQYLAAPAYVAPLARGGALSLGAVAQYASTERRRGTLVDEARPYGSGGFGQVGARAGYALDTRDRPASATRGVALTASASAYPALWDVARPFGDVRAEAATYLSAATVLEPTLALRVGGQRVWGDFPFHEAAYVGGASTLRGWGEQRFAGRGSAYGSAELRLLLAHAMLFVPGDLGVFGLADAGRVYATGERSGAWHVGAGGGVWVAPLTRAHTISLAVVRGREQTGVYLRTGFAY
jgi:outer membrane protein assembly factor BamA